MVPPLSQRLIMSGDAPPIAVIATNASWNLVNFRIDLIRAVQAAGYRVIAVAPEDQYTPKLAKLGIEFLPIEIQNSGVSPVADSLLFARYLGLLRGIRPAVFLGFTVKPNIYGSLAAHLLGIRVINNVSGLGTVFIKKGLLTRIVTALYRLAFRRSAVVFFQNRDDLDQFVQGKMVRADHACLIPGSGIDLTRFQPAKAKAEGREEFRFLLIARLLWDKGVQEFVDAARTIKTIEPNVRCQILGFVDVDNRTAVPRETLDRWVKEGWVDFLGSTDDVRPFIEQADCVVLPSYREGLPRTLVEGSAMGKPLVATDVPGVRDVIDEGVTGFLCKVRSARSLADAMLKMVRLPRGEREKMGAAGRLKVEREFSQTIVIQSYLAALAGKIP
jgi:glycosyltransferase involved in cell wall biosynthesis